MIGVNLGMANNTHYWSNNYIKCPCYHKESADEVRCDGLCGDLTTQHFQNGKAKDDWYYDFCNGNYRGCPMYQALAEDE
jgi:hypothetical protein